MSENLFFNKSDLLYCGENVIIGKTVRIRRPELVSIGDNTIIDDFTYISCKLNIGNYCHIASNVNMSGGNGEIIIGDFVGIASGCSLHPCSSDYLIASLDLPSVPPKYRFGGQCETIFIEDYVLLGANTVVLPGVKLPEGFASAAHSTISKKEYSPWTLYGGLNASKIIHRSPKKLKNVIQQMKDDGVYDGNKNNRYTK
ncbi:MAG: hypothetical protein Q8933_06150 [Bacteroidota bacterium]|nr:hypothetical protein [Bacteroidota bacterium]MDP4190743.1 hypothetical protein [Bacteroidota bacterium]MDP4195503.1 hypothetical protein [Bacteroidota bacterium]